MADAVSEVGSKDQDEILPPCRWVEMIRAELEAGNLFEAEQGKKRVPKASATSRR